MSSSDPFMGLWGLWDPLDLVFELLERRGNDKYNEYEYIK